MIHTREGSLLKAHQMLWHSLQFTKVSNSVISRYTGNSVYFKKLQNVLIRSRKSKELVDLVVKDSGSVILMY